MGLVKQAGETALSRADLYRTYWDASVEGLFAIQVTAQGKFLCAGLNAALEAVTGLDSRQTAGKEAFEYLDPHSAEALVSLYRECLQAGEPITRSHLLELPTGVRVYDLSVVPVRGAGGRIELLLGRAQDVTDLERSVRESQSAQGLLRDVLTSIETQLAVLDRTGRIIMANASWRQLGPLRGALDGPAGANYLDICTRAADTGDTAAAAVLQALKQVRAGEHRTLSCICRWETSVFQMRATRFKRGPELWIVVSYEDVTAMHDAQQELSDLTERLLDIQEEERRRIALELHDSTSQHLVAVQLGLTVIGQGRATDQTLADMRDELMEAHREIRTLSYLLHPPRLEAERLAATLRQFVEGFERRTGASVELRLEGAVDDVPFRVQRAIFRVFQEALANAHKHANARRIAVELSRSDEGLRLVVADDGRNPERPFVPGVGVPGMEARIERFGGNLSVAPSGAGTTVSAFIRASALEAEGAFERP